GAWLHINSARFTREDAKGAMTLFGTTSPSYPIMLSLDLARAWLQEEGEGAFAALCARVAELGLLASKKGIGLPPGRALCDPARLTLETAAAGVSGRDAEHEMRRRGIVAEFADERHVVLLPSPFNTPADFEAVAAYLGDFRQRAPIPLSQAEPVRPRQAATLREALSAPAEAVETDCAAGRICVQCHCPCPPGVPLLIPGELVTAAVAEKLKSYGVFSLKVVK
ncbi:MAG: amino acid decarboxylase, partial [Clostridia bacterium]|nr:amino acid decarboxylase [Clostridia bacterium]